MACKECNKIFDSNYLLTKHIRDEHQATVVVRFKDSTFSTTLVRDEQTNNFVCPICSFSTTSPRTIQYHCTHSCLEHDTIYEPSTSTQESVSEHQTVLSVHSSNSGSISDDIEMENIIETQESQQRSEIISVTSTSNQYNTTWRQHGLYIHIPSGKVICITCKEAISIHAAYTHWRVIHNTDLSDSEDDFKMELMINQATERIKEQFRKRPVVQRPIVGIKVEKGYKCNQCDLPTADAAFYHNNLDRIKDHLYRYHPNYYQDYQAIFVQRLYKANQYRVFVRVLDNAEDSRTSELTRQRESRGRELFQTYLQRGPTASVFTEPNYGIHTSGRMSDLDPRTVHQFYVDTNWDSLFGFFEKENNRENRILFHQWVQGAVNSTNNVYDVVEQSVKQYAQAIQTKLEDRKHLYFRQRVMSPSNQNMDPVGLRPLQPVSLAQYCKSWSKYVIMLIKVILPDIQNNTDLNQFYHEFAPKILTQNQIEHLNNYIQLLQESPIDVDELHGALHELFISLLCVQCPSANEDRKTSSSVFMAFSQLDWEGNWKPVHSATKMPARLMYLTRMVIFYHCVVLQSYPANLPI